MSPGGGALFSLAASVLPHSRAHSPLMNDTPSITKFAAFVQLKDFAAPPRSYVRRLGDYYQCDLATLSKDRIRAYYLELRQFNIQDLTLNIQHRTWEGAGAECEDESGDKSPAVQTLREVRWR